MEENKNQGKAMNNAVEKSLKVLLINGSPHARGNTFIALSEVAARLNMHGIETEIVQKNLPWPMD